jgi:hypothetical protein
LSLKTRYHGKPKSHTNKHAAKTIMGLDVCSVAAISQLGTNDGSALYRFRKREASTAAQTAVTGTMINSIGKWVNANTTSDIKNTINVHAMAVIILIKQYLWRASEYYYYAAEHAQCRV